MNMDMVQEAGHVPPQEVQSNAKRGLELRQKHGRGGTEVGVARARNLSNGDSIPLDTINRMVSYFARHEVDKKGEGWGTDSAGYIAWLLWGGDAGKSWAEKIAKQADDDEPGDEVQETGMYTRVGEGETNDPPNETNVSAGAKPDSKSDVREIRLSTPQFAFKGQFPDVPLAPGVDQAALVANDPNPLYVVRPLAVLNAVSDNGLKYDDQLLTEIERQVIEKKPAARQGHVSEESSSWEFPPDVGLWVGARRVGNTLYGKSYIYPNTPFHQMVIKRKAAGSTLSNSIWGKGHFVPNNDGTQSLVGLELESIDFAPAERAALSGLGGEFETTSEMSGNGNGDGKMAEQHSDEKQDLELIRKELAKSVKETAPSMLHEMMTKEQRQHCAEMQIRELEPSAVYQMIPDMHRKHISECYAKEFGQKMPAAEMSGVAELKQSVAELTAQLAQNKQQLAEYKSQDFNRALDEASHKPFETWTVKRGSEQEKGVNSAKANFKMFIVAEMATMDGGQREENVTKAAELAWPKFEPQAALLLSAITGGGVIAGLKGTVSEQRMSNQYGYDPKTGKYDTDVARQARMKIGY